MNSVPLPLAALVIPALNEEPVIAATLRAIPPGLFVQVIVADNGSTDRTAEIARASGATVVVEPERGYGAACQRALAALAPEVDAVSILSATGYTPGEYVPARCVDTAGYDLLVAPERPRLPLA